MGNAVLTSGHTAGFRNYLKYYRQKKKRGLPQKEFLALAAKSWAKLSKQRKLMFENIDIVTKNNIKGKRKPKVITKRKPAYKPRVENPVKKAKQNRTRRAIKKQIPRQTKLRTNKYEYGTVRGNKNFDRLGIGTGTDRTAKKWIKKKDYSKNLYRTEDIITRKRKPNVMPRREPAYKPRVKNRDKVAKKKTKNSTGLPNNGTHRYGYSTDSGIGYFDSLHSGRMDRIAKKGIKKKHVPKSIYRREKYKLPKSSNLLIGRGKMRDKYKKRRS